VAQTLFHIPLQVAGVPVFGFGLLLAVWAVASVVLVAWVVRQQGFCADTFSYAGLLLVIGAIIAWLLPRLCDDEGLPIHGYGVMMLVAALGGTGLGTWRARRMGLDPDLVLSLAFWLFVPGIIGARAFYVVRYWPEFASRYEKGGPETFLGSLLNVTQGGLVVYGAFLGMVLGMLLFVRKYRLPLLACCDLASPSLMLALAIGRIGCLLNGCCFGDTCDLPWAVTFPEGAPAYWSQVARGEMYGFRLSAEPTALPKVQWVDPQSLAGRAGLKSDDLLNGIDGYAVKTAGQAHRLLMESFEEHAPLMLRTEHGAPIRLPAAAAAPRSHPVHPTQIYSSIDALLLCLLLLAYAAFHRRDGEVFAVMVSIYPVTRFLIESIRTDEAAVLWGMSISQNLSLLLIAFAAGLWAYLLRRPRGVTWG
jgi:phosphatidylglycerol:prolipoprotein diacylglycerol transferase